MGPTAEPVLVSTPLALAARTIHNDITHAQSADGGAVGVQLLNDRPPPLSHRTLPGNNCVFFAKVPPYVQEQELLQLFGSCGAVVGINLYRSWATTKRSKGCGIVEFETAEGAAAALQALNGANVWPQCLGPLVVEPLERGRPVMLPSTLKSHPRFGPSSMRVPQVKSAIAAAAAGRPKQPIAMSCFSPLHLQQPASQPPGLPGSSFGLQQQQQALLFNNMQQNMQQHSAGGPVQYMASLPALSTAPGQQGLAGAGMQYVVLPAGMQMQGQPHILPGAAGGSYMLQSSHLQGNYLAMGSLPAAAGAAPASAMQGPNVVYVSDPMAMSQGPVGGSNLAVVGSSHMQAFDGQYLLLPATAAQGVGSGNGAHPMLAMPGGSQMLLADQAQPQLLMQVHADPVLVSQVASQGGAPMVLSLQPQQ